MRASTTPDEDCRLRLRNARLMARPELVKNIPRVAFEEAGYGDKISKFLWYDINNEEADAPGGCVKVKSSAVYRRCVTQPSVKSAEALRLQRAKDIASVRTLAETIGWDIDKTYDYYGLDLEPKAKNSNASDFERQTAGQKRVRDMERHINQPRSDAQNLKRQRLASSASIRPVSPTPQVLEPRLPRSIRSSPKDQTATCTIKGPPTLRAEPPSQRVNPPAPKEEAHPPQGSSGSVIDALVNLKVEDSESDDDIVCLDGQPPGWLPHAHPLRRGSATVKIDRPVKMQAPTTLALAPANTTVWVRTHIDEVARVVTRSRYGTDALQTLATELLGLVLVGGRDLDPTTVTDDNEKWHVETALDILGNPHTAQKVVESTSAALLNRFRHRITQLKSA